MRFPVPQGFSSWWDEEQFPPEPLDLALEWRRGGKLTVGQLHPALGALRFGPKPADFTNEGPERVNRLVAKAFTRAGWLRPRIDPAALLHLVDLRSHPVRVEFIVDTNAMVEGVGHWLADHFADRCDLVVTAVSLRELQDARERAGLGVDLGSKKTRQRADILGARQLYLAASRFREQAGYDRVLWRELELDDTALLLSRGAANTKSSESDTLLLRAVRRSIHARVNKLARFFVTGDTALARRAATELPERSVIAAQVQDVEPGEVLFPCAWWPGPDQGYRVQRHASRLVWELLCIGDAVTLSATDGRLWRFCAFDNPMWPSDYLEPWVGVESPAALPIPSSAKEQAPGAQEAPTPDTPPSHPGMDTTFSIWPSVPTGMERLDHNLRISGAKVLDVLAVLVVDSHREVPLPAAITSKQQRGHVRLLLNALDLADVDQEAWTARPRLRRQDLVEAWLANNHGAVFGLLRAWVPLEEWATLAHPPERPRRTPQAARTLAALLGQGMFVDHHWLPGGRTPTVARMRAAVLSAVSKHPQHAIPVYTLLVDVFLRRLGVAPVRVVRAWDDLWSAGVFDDFEPREGGSSSGNRVEEFAHFTADGWDLEKVDLESCGGTRDLVYRRNV